MLQNFKLVSQEGVDGSGGVGGFAKPPKLTSNDKDNPFLQRVWPLDLPCEQEMNVVFQSRPKMLKIQHQAKKRKFGNRRDDFADYEVDVERRNEKWKGMYREALPFRTKNNKKHSTKREAKSLGIACMDPMWEKALGAEVEISSWMSRDDPDGFHGWKLGIVEAARWSRDQGGCVKLAVRLVERKDRVLEGVPMSNVRVPQKIVEARARAARLNKSKGSSRRRKSVKQAELAPPHLRLPPGSDLVTQHKLPPGWSTRSHTRTGGGIYYVYVAPDDSRHRSIAAVNRYLGLLPPGKRPKRSSKGGGNGGRPRKRMNGNGSTKEHGTLRCIHCGRNYKQKGSLETHMAKCSANESVKWQTYVTFPSLFFS